MKTYLTKFFILSLSSSIFLILSGCMKDSKSKSISEKVFSVDDLYNYCKIDESNCGETLACEGESILAYGTVFKMNTFPTENRFILYEDASESSISLDVNTISNSDAIFQKLEKIMDEDSEKTIKLKAIINIVDLPMNGSCGRGIILNLSNKESLSLMN